MKPFHNLKVDNDHSSACIVNWAQLFTFNCGMKKWGAKQEKQPLNTEPDTNVFLSFSHQLAHTCDSLAFVLWHDCFPPSVFLYVHHHSSFLFSPSVFNQASVWTQLCIESIDQENSSPHLQLHIPSHRSNKQSAEIQTNLLPSCKQQTV